LELPENVESGSPWRAMCAELRRTVGESTYEIWLAPLEVKAWDGRVLLLQAPPSTHDWVRKRFGHILEACARTVIGSAIQVAFATAAGAESPRPSTSDLGRLDPAAGLNPRYTFDQFIIGEGNRLAHAAALSVAEYPGAAWNPLFLYAPPGLGKTHLLHAIGNYVLAFGAGTTVRYTTVEEFTNHFITALNSRSIDRFKQAYRDVDVLLIDDVQFLASKAKTEEEFFHTFNALHTHGRQLVLTCDRLPRQMLAIEERLRDRFEAGLVADIQPPAFSTRLAILRKRAALDNVELADLGVLELIAERVTDNVRALEGALIRIVAYHSLTGRPINLDLARTVLDTMYPSTRPRATAIADIQQRVAGHFGLSVEQLVSPSRAARIAWARQVSIYFSRELTDASLQYIGEAFGGRNHATVLHACKRVSDRVSGDAEAEREVAELMESLQHR
jgi:chromosomal replication initiator protein